jgi:hypothetical protein
VFYIKGMKMKRFVIRNYGPSRQLRYKKYSICIANDSVIETNDENMVKAMTKHENIHVTDRGSEVVAATDPIEEFGDEVQRKCTVDNPEALYKEQFPDPDGDGNETSVDSDVSEALSDDDISYDDMRAPELKALAKNRGVYSKGMRKGEIIEALESYDEVEVVT